MSEKRTATVIGSLPHSRPQRRSAKRSGNAAPATAGSAPAAAGTTPTRRSTTATRTPRAPAKPRTSAPPRAPAASRPGSTAEPAATHRAPLRTVRTIDGRELVTTLVRAGAELTEIGLTLAARGLRSAVSRLPRP